MFNFCIQKPHSDFEGLIDGFVSIFAKTRIALDEVNEQQIKLFCTYDKKFRCDAYQPIEKICAIFTQCIINRIEELNEKKDFHVSQNIAKKVVKALESDKQLTLFFQPFDDIHNSFKLVTNDHLIEALSASTPTPSEESFNELLIFIFFFFFSKIISYFI